MTEEVIRAPEVLCEEGDIDADDLFILVEGRASVTVLGGPDPGGEGREREVAVLGPGEVVGESERLHAGGG